MKQFLKNTAIFGVGFCLKGQSAKQLLKNASIFGLGFGVGGYAGFYACYSQNHQKDHFEEDE